jgi:hypothetical protein
MAGVFANGSTFKLGSNTVSEITNISGPNFSSDTLDDTTHNNSDKFRTFKKGLTDAGEISIEGYLDYADYNTLEDAASTTSQYTATITMPTSPSVTKWEASVYVTGLEEEAPFDGLLGFSATMKVTGKPTLSQV